MPVIFETSRLIVRPFTGSDDDLFFQINGDPEVVRYIRPAKTKEECDVFLQQVIHDATEQPLYGRWAVIEKTISVFVGSFAVIPVEQRDWMQMGYALLPSYWGLGYATELTRAGLDYVFTHTPLEVIYAITEKPNKASQKVLVKSGYRHHETWEDKGKEIVSFIFEKKDYRSFRMV